MKISSHNIFVHILFAALLHKFCTCQERSSNDPEDGRDISISSGQDRGVILILNIAFSLCEPFLAINCNKILSFSGICYII